MNREFSEKTDTIRYVMSYLNLRVKGDELLEQDEFDESNWTLFFPARATLKTTQNICRGSIKTSQDCPWGGFFRSSQ